MKEEILSYFGQSYYECRSNLLKSIIPYNFIHLEHKSNVQGINSEELFIDEILINPNKSKHLLVIISGTHGVEGFIGSACQNYFVDKLVKLYPNNSFLLVHAINPYGFSLCRRVNENNVDINRNFVNNYAIKNNDYLNYNEVLTMASYAGKYKPEKLFIFLIVSILLGKRDNIQKAITKGQYEINKGLFYGGNKPEWSNKVWNSLCDKYQKIYSLHLLDIHSGLGKKGKGCLLSQSSYKQYFTMNRYFNNEIENINDKNKLSSVLHGTLVSSVLTKKSNSAIVLEYGTYSAVRVLISLCQDNWAWNNANKILGGKENRTRMKDIFYINEINYKTSILGKFEKTVEQYIEYIAKECK